MKKEEEEENLLNKLDLENIDEKMVINAENYYKETLTFNLLER